MEDDYDEIHESRAAKRSRAKTAAQRTREWREQSKEVGRPEAKAVDRAMVEATSYLVSLNRQSPVIVSIPELVRVSTIILVREGYDRAFSKAGIVDRLRPRARHDEMASMPSRSLHYTARLIQPPMGADAWDEKDVAYIRRLTTQAG